MEPHPHTATAKDPPFRRSVGCPNLQACEGAATLPSCLSALHALHPMPTLQVHVCVPYTAGSQASPTREKPEVARLPA